MLRNPWYIYLSGLLGQVHNLAQLAIGPHLGRSVTGIQRFCEALEVIVEQMYACSGRDRQTGGSVSQVVVVPTSAQPRLCRPLRYGDSGQASSTSTATARLAAAHSGIWMSWCWIGSLLLSCSGCDVRPWPRLLNGSRVVRGRLSCRRIRQARPRGFRFCRGYLETLVAESTSRGETT